MFEGCEWFNEPKSWSREGDTLEFTTDEGSDLWRETFYGFERDSGHAFGVSREGDFTAQVRVRARPSSLYDQAGLLVRRDARRWTKATVEVSDGAPMLSTVVTDGRSDWSVSTFPGEATDFWLRASLSKGALRVQWSLDGLRWPLMRLAPFVGEGPCFVGALACSPERGGMQVTFSDFAVGDALAKDLHDLS